MIKRNICNELLISAKEFPSVTILGPRQSGKTTLAKMMFPNYKYISLEDPDIRRQALDDPRGLLSSIKGGAIFDEVQRVPDLLSFLQGIIDADRRTGRFILTGSHQSLLHEFVTQSLAGRTAVLTLLPFTVDETRHYDTCPRSPYEWIVKGFYPGVYENNIRPVSFYRSYTATYLERDLRQMIQVKDISRFDTFLRLLAGRIGQLVNYTSLSNDVGVSSVTIKNWISILKSSHILYELPPWFANIRKRFVKSPKLYFTDTGLAAWLLGIETAEQAERDPLRGALYENFIVAEVLKTRLNQGLEPQLYFFRDSKGNEVDLLQTSTGRRFKAFEIKSAATFQPQYVKGIDVFKSSLPESVSVESHVWYNGKQQTEYQGTGISNPLLSGFD